jgi:hypothetical protein
MFMTKKTRLSLNIFLLDLEEIYLDNKTKFWGIILPLLVGFFIGLSAAVAVVAFAFFMFLWNGKKDKALKTLILALKTAFVVGMFFLIPLILAF